MIAYALSVQSPPCLPQFLCKTLHLHQLENALFGCKLEVLTDQRAIYILLVRFDHRVRIEGLFDLVGHGVQPFCPSTAARMAVIRASVGMSSLSLRLIVPLLVLMVGQAAWKAGIGREPG